MATGQGISTYAEASVDENEISAYAEASVDKNGTKGAKSRKRKIWLDKKLQNENGTKGAKSLPRRGINIIAMGGNPWKKWRNENPPNRKLLLISIGFIEAEQRKLI